MPTRRQTIAGGSGAVAALAGLWWTRGRESDDPPEDPEAPSEDDADDSEPTPAQFVVDASVDRPDPVRVYHDVAARLEIENRGERTGTYDYRVGLYEASAGDRDRKEVSGRLGRDAAASHELEFSFAAPGDYELRVDTETIDAFRVQPRAKTVPGDDPPEPTAVETGGRGSFVGGEEESG